MNAARIPFRFLPIAVVTAMIFADAARADEKATIEQLRSVGAEIVERDGAASQVQVKDTAKFTAADFAALGTLSKVKLLTLSGANVTDATLDQLAGLTELEDLSTNVAQFTDAGLKKLTAFKNLKQIKFFHTSQKSKEFNGSGFAHLAEMKQLRRLTVAGCPFNDEGMAAVGKLTQLENFRTWHTYQTEAGNVHLKSLKNLKSLHLGQRLRHYDGTSNAWSLSDATFDVLANLKSLEDLKLDESRLSFDALAKLQALPNLKTLGLNRIDIPAAEIEKLKQAMPKVQIDWKPLTDEERTAMDRFLKP